MNTDRLYRSAMMTLAGLVFAGCALPEAPASYVGSVADSDAKVGAVATEGRVTFYLCGGPTTLAHDTRWWVGDVADPTDLSLDKDGWKLTGDLVAGTGHITDLGGNVRTWSISPAIGEDEGLYGLKEGDACRTGAIVGHDDAGEGWIQGAYCESKGDGGSIFAQVTPITPLTSTELGLRLQVKLADEVKQLVVKRVIAP